MSNFRALAYAVRPYIRDAGEVLACADALSSLFPTDAETAPESNVSRRPMNHDALVFIACRHGRILKEMKDNHLAVAIKEMRAFTGATLKEAKDACADPKVAKAALAYCCEDCTPSS